MVRLTEDGLVLTLDSDDEDPLVNGADDDGDDDEEAAAAAGAAAADASDDPAAAESEGGKGPKGKKKKQKKEKKGKKAQQSGDGGKAGGAGGEMDPDFAFDEADDGYGAKASWDFRSALAKLGLKAKGGDGEEQGEQGEQEEGEEEDDDGLDADAVKELATEEALEKVARRKERQQQKEAAKAEREEKRRRAAARGGEEGDPERQEDTDADPKAKEFFTELGDELRVRPAAPGQAILFSQLNLSRPLLRAVEAMGYVTPTAIQTAVVPVVLAGKDVCASAVTGSGKTAAFCLPILERLLFRPKSVAATRVLIVSPTRELAVQTHLMLQRLTQFTGDMTACLVVGGSRNLRAQEAELRARPDIVVCTPGRMLDHLHNSHSVLLDDLEILVMDEVDQLVDLGFAAEVEALVKECPRQRQTLLFSATMTAKVDALAQLALNRPVRVRVDASYEVAPRLEQEFVRVRGASDEHRHAILLALVSRTFRKRTLLFCNTKVDAHRMRLVLELSGVKAAELHGNLNQAERLESLQRFKDGAADVLVCTDLAARGLDIAGIQTVINAEMPRTRATYVHRVGRTARAGCGGRAVSLVPDSARLLMKQVVADVEDKGSVKSRVVPPPVLAHYEGKVAGLQAAIEARLREEDADRLAQKAQREAERAQNLLEHREEIMQRPARQWFQSETEKQAVRAQAAEALLSGNGGSSKPLHASVPAGEIDPALLSKKQRRALEEAAKKKKPHRLTRQKRRRLEALQADEEERQEVLGKGKGKSNGDDGDGDGDGDGNGKKAKALSKKERKRQAALAVSQKSAAREAKRAAQPKRARAEGRAGGAPKSLARASGSAGTYDLGSGFDAEMSTLYEKKAAATKDAGGGNGGDGKKRKRGGGDGGDGDDGGGGLSSAYKFRGLSNGPGLRKSGKPSHHGFKSRSKHKRR